MALLALSLGIVKNVKVPVSNGKDKHEYYCSSEVSRFDKWAYLSTAGGGGDTLWRRRSRVSAGGNQLLWPQSLLLVH